MKLTKRHRLILLAYSLAASLALYCFIADFGTLQHIWEIARMRQTVAEVQQSPDKMHTLILNMQKRVAERNDLEGWFLLGRLYLATNRFAEASNAFAKAYQLNTAKVELLSWQLQSLYMAENGTFTDAITTLMMTVNERDPNSRVLEELQKLQKSAYQPE